MTISGTPTIFRVQKLSSERPSFPKDQKYDMTQYRKQKPCGLAIWKRRDQWWQIQIDSLSDLVEFQKELRHDITLSRGTITINDVPLSYIEGYDCG